jgi:hypothetical protein
MIRPIGTRFTIHYPPSEWSTDYHPTDILYGVIRHVKVARFRGDKDGILAEELKAIAIKSPRGSQGAEG